jgi:hypothetical protein
MATQQLAEFRTVSDGDPPASGASVRTVRPEPIVLSVRAGEVGSAEPSATVLIYAATVEIEVELTGLHVSSGRVTAFSDDEET